MITAETLVKRIEDLPPLPDIVMRILQLARDPNVSASEIIEIIRLDPAITAKVLKLCNSSYFGLPRKVDSVKEALVFIGTDALINFVLAGSLSRIFQKPFSGYGFEKGELWKHAICCASGSEVISRRTKKKDVTTAFTAGLLHDVGKIVLNAYLADEYRSILEIVESEKLAILEAEQRVLGFTHSEVGLQIAECWNLPPFLREPILYHHDPTKAEEYPELVACVHVANILCLSLGMGVGSIGMACRLVPEALEVLGMTSDHLFNLSVELLEEYRRAEDLLYMT